MGTAFQNLDSGCGPAQWFLHPQGPSTQYVGAWVWGNSTCSTCFGQVYDYEVLGPLGSSIPYEQFRTYRDRDACDVKVRNLSIK